MKILMLAPHPFYQDRGTPIAADLVLSALSERGEKVDVIAFPEGRDVEYPNVTIYRTPAFKLVENIRPGFSWKKLICDVFLLFQAIRLMRHNKYDLVHAGEEAVFIALVIQTLFGTPYVYDMDSSLVQQLIDKYPTLKVIKGLLCGCEKLAVRKATAVIAVCHALAADIQSYQPQKVVVIPDISLLNRPPQQPSTESPNASSSIKHSLNDNSIPELSNEDRPVLQLKEYLEIEGTLLMYVGNLEGYQGIDLMLESIAQVISTSPTDHLVIIGGNTQDIQKYQVQAHQLKISGNVHFLGPRPTTQLKQYLEQADILMSPRIQGNNTPMKLYSYLDSGKALLATNLTTHTQVLTGSPTNKIALLAEPNAAEFAKGIQHLIDHPRLRASMGRAAQAYIAQHHTYAAFSQKLSALYNWVQGELTAHSARSVVAPSPMALSLSAIGKTRKSEQ